MSLKLYSVKTSSGDFDFISSSSLPKAGWEIIPEQYSLEDLPFLSCVETPNMVTKKFFNKETNQEETGTFQDGVTRVYSLDTNAKQEAETLKTNTKAIQDAYVSMNEEVYNKMYEVFETRKSDSASAYYETFKHMKENASLYVSKGIKVTKRIMNPDETELFDEGASLDTEAKIVSYANRKIELANEYAVWRMGRIQEFKNFKTQTLGA